MNCPHCKKPIELVGTKEAAEVLGRSVSSFQTLYEREGFPEPWALVGQGRLWLKADMVAFQRKLQSASLEKLVTALSKNLDGLDEKTRAKVLAQLGASD